jgi:predicted nuclease of predicted toxin-antitoxin system
MARTILFHLDENCQRAIAEGLRRRGVDLTTTPEAGLLNATDDEQLAFCQAQARVLFTQDRDFLRIHAGGIAHFGIVYCDKGTRSIGEIIQGLVLIWEILEPAEMANRVEYL